MLKQYKLIKTNEVISGISIYLEYIYPLIKIVGIISSDSIMIVLVSFYDYEHKIRTNGNMSDK